MIRANSAGATVVSVNNPNGLEKTADGQMFFWMGNRPTILTVMSSANGCAQLSGSAIFGPSSTLPYRTIVVGGVSNSESDNVLSHEGQFHLPVRVRAGFNELPLAVKEPATRHLAADPRPLLLRVDKLSLESQACEVPPR